MCLYLVYGVYNYIYLRKLVKVDLLDLAISKKITAIEDIMSLFIVSKGNFTPSCRRDQTGKIFVLPEPVKKCSD